MWKNQNPNVSLMGIHDDTATIENTLTVPQKAEENYHAIQQFHTQIFNSKELKIGFKLIHYSQQPKGGDNPRAHHQTNTMWYVIQPQKKWNSDTCYNMGEPQKHYAR